MQCDLSLYTYYYTQFRWVYSSNKVAITTSHADCFTGLQPQTVTGGSIIDFSKGTLSSQKQNIEITKTPNLSNKSCKIPVRPHQIKHSSYCLNLILSRQLFYFLNYFIYIFRPTSKELFSRPICLPK